MKTAELLEYVHRRKTEAEKEALRNAPDAWRKALRKELTKFNQQFGIYLRKSSDLRLRKSDRFDQWSTDTAAIGGEYEFGHSVDNLTLSKEKRFELWKKAYAKRIKQLLNDGYGVKLFSRLSDQLPYETTEEEIYKRISQETRPRYRGDPTKAPLIVTYQIVVIKPK